MSGIGLYKHCVYQFYHWIIFYVNYYLYTGDKVIIPNKNKNPTCAQNFKPITGTTETQGWDTCSNTQIINFLIVILLALVIFNAQWEGRFVDDSNVGLFIVKNYMYVWVYMNMWLYICMHIYIYKVSK